MGISKRSKRAAPQGGQEKDLAELLEERSLRVDREQAKLPEFGFDQESSISDLHRVLDTAVVGQEAGKGRLSVLLSLHLAMFDEDHSGNPIPNAILLGPTGVGKTHSMRTLADDFALPFAVVDSTSLVQAGIVGMQVEDITQVLHDEASRILREGGFRSTPEDVTRLAERGVVVLDEFDKIATPDESETSSDASRRQVQRHLLKFAEGAKIRVGVKHRFTAEAGDQFLDTSNLLLIASGAFADLTERTAGKRQQSELYRELFGENAVVAEDIRLYGFLPELVARFPLVIEYEPLDVRELLEILARSADSPLRTWERFASLRGYELEIEPEALAILASRAARLNIGARGLQQLLFPYLSGRFLTAAEEGSERIAVTVQDLQMTSALYKTNPVSNPQDECVGNALD